MQTERGDYIGRFAPSPTGELHFGSLVAAVASFLQARSRGGQWLVRVENIDPPRELAGSAQRIMEDLRRLNMDPDGPILFQGDRVDVYRAARDSLLASGLAFKCSCSRASLSPGAPYPGTCRNGPVTASDRLSTRIKVDDSPIEFFDGIQGRQAENLTETCGDFVIWRSDDLPAYQLAVVIDDAFQRVTEVVRGADLLDSTPRQIHLQNVLGLKTPGYLHLPVATVAGRKLGKRFASDPVSARSPVASLSAALGFLGHPPPRQPDLESLWSWAINHWDASRVPKTLQIALDDDS